MGRWYYDSIFILSTVWASESSAEFDKLGKTWWKSWLPLIIKLFRAWLSSLMILRPRGNCDLTLVVTIGDTSWNQPKRLDSDNQINISTLIHTLVLLTTVVFFRVLLSDELVMSDLVRRAFKIVLVRCAFLRVLLSKLPSTSPWLKGKQSIPCKQQRHTLIGNGMHLRSRKKDGSIQWIP